MRTIYKFITITLLLTSLNAFSLEYVMFKGGKFVKVTTVNVEKDCGQDFTFRSKFKDQAPVFLTKSLIQAAFQGKIITGLSLISTNLKENPGRCAWIEPSEFGQL